MPVEPSTLRELESAPLSAELLAYYRERLASSEAEIAQLLDRVDEISESHSTLHKARWEVHKRMDEISDLQKALSDAHVYLWDEKERSLRLQAEIDELKLQEIEDRRKIQHLLSLVSPVMQDVTYIRDAPPETITLYPHARATTAAAPAAPYRRARSGLHGFVRTSQTTGEDGASGNGLADTSRAPAAPPARAVAAVQPSGPRAAGWGLAGSDGCAGDGQGGCSQTANVDGTRVLRTVYLPNEQVRFLLPVLPMRLSAALAPCH